MPIMYYCSDGTRVSQATIDRKYSESLRDKFAFAGNQSARICEGCLKRMSINSDHTIARARCKVIHKTELIWNKYNYVRSCDTCHHEWENFKSGKWLDHLNVVERSAFYKQHDPEGWNIRVQLTEAA